MINNHSGLGGGMNFKLTAFAALLLVPGQAMAEEVRVDCVTDQRIICRDDETTCREPVRETGRYHFTFDLTKKTGSLVFCSEGTGCMKPRSAHCRLRLVRVPPRLRRGLSRPVGQHLCVGADDAAGIHFIQLAICCDRKRHLQSQSFCNSVRTLRRSVTGRRCHLLRAVTLAAVSGSHRDRRY